MYDKPLWLSKTFWGVVIAVGAPIAAKYGWTLDAEGLANDFVSLAGAALAIYGRFTAERPVRLL